MLRVIETLDLAGKLSAIRRRELPRAAAQMESDPELRSVLCFVQWASAQPGGLEGLADRMLTTCPDLIGPSEDGCKIHINEPHTGVDCLLRQVPHEELAGERLLRDSAWLFDNGTEVVHLGGREPDNPAESDRSPGRSARGRTLRDALDATQTESKRLEARLKSIRPQDIHDVAASVAKNRLPAYLQALCVDWAQDFRDPEWWFFRDPICALKRTAASLAEQELGKIAETEVSARILDSLNYAWEKRRTVWIEGNHRRGKTQTLETGCRAYPGRARLVRVPASDSINELLRCVARALLIPYQINTPGAHLRELIAEVLDLTGICLVLDECQFLYGMKVTRTSKPSRLEWCREIIDDGCPCVLCTSPQSYKKAEAQFTKATKYPMDQWLGRWIKRIDIPNLLEDEDLLKVARQHFPAADDNLLCEIAGRAGAHHGYLKAIEEVRVCAEYRAGQACQEPSTAFIQAALDEVLPMPKAATQSQPQADLEQPPKPPRRRPARAMQPARRGVAPDDFPGLEQEREASSRIRTATCVPA